MFLISYPPPFFVLQAVQQQGLGQEFSFFLLLPFQMRWKASPVFFKKVNDFAKKKLSIRHNCQNACLCNNLLDTSWCIVQFFVENVCILYDYTRYMY